MLANIDDKQLIMPQILRTLLVAITAFMLAGCVHYMTIEQGVQIQQAQVDQLKAGMTPSQVEYVLGTPNLVDPYQANTWYYLYTNQPSRQPMTEEKLIIYFNNNQLVKVTGNFNIPASLQTSNAKLP